MSLPVLDRRVPSFFSFPLSELLTFVVGIMLVICTYRLLHRLFHDFRVELTPFIHTVFLILSSIWATGVGIHACANTVQNELTNDHALYPMIHDNLHRFWSHNMLQCGYYGLLLLFIWVDNSSKVQVYSASTSQLIMLETAWSVILGAAYTTIAVATHTVLVTLIFYVLALVQSGLTLSKYTGSLSVSCATGLCFMSVYLVTNILL